MNNKKLFLSLIYSSMALLILVSLGTWQLERLRWKTDILSSMRESLSLPPLKITGQVIDNIDQYSFRRIQLTGNYLYKDNITIYSKVFNKKVGKHLIVPLETQYGIILVNRGFIPSDFNIENNIKSGEISINGIVKFILQLLIIMPIYQVLLLFFGYIFFQFNFFFKFVKKFLKLFGLGFLFRD